jgi:hypothetical protein
MASAQRSRPPLSVRAARATGQAEGGPTDNATGSHRSA